MKQRVLVIGGGAAGMMSAGIAAQRGLDVHLFEKNDKLGKKIFISGKGRCNFTNASDITTIMENIIRNPYFLYSALYRFTNNDLIEFFNKLGVRSKIERGNRVFPKSDKSNDIVQALYKFLMYNGVTIHFNQKVDRVLVKNNKVEGIQLNSGEKVKGERIIIATGGLSYPKTGSTGDGFKMAKELGHHIIKPLPSLVPIVIHEKWVKDLQGLSLKNIEMTLWEKNKKIKSEFGEMIFTHYGISGPIILSLSAHMSPPYSKYLLSLNLKPALTQDQLDLRLQKDFKKYIRKQFKNSLEDLLPKKIIPIIIKLSGIDGNKFVHQITKKEREKLVHLLQNINLSVTNLRPISTAIVTAGGIDTREINPSTMESKLIKNLFFAGEVIDIDGLTGGFNLQIAFSTGYLAGINC
ncbi:NAD(P)/FAD-dependent oxidoreductase [Garciella nitratireducens]|uniref:NAD(P)/FAD-dependent oxidoreductase n=1 Tax=Garciella nitratireducens TaxID=218205 RepID=UPI000DE82647|nr:NAD(P)/FAD-dependent oxidoreductase [Garciella nitratireducens]RBP45596.1 hypothetical protein DFR81_102133 [Garciella nitratireducens]